MMRNGHGPWIQRSVTSDGEYGFADRSDAMALMSCRPLDENPRLKVHRREMCRLRALLLTLAAHQFCDSERNRAGRNRTLKFGIFPTFDALQTLVGSQRTRKTTTKWLRKDLTHST